MSWRRAGTLSTWAITVFAAAFTIAQSLDASATVVDAAAPIPPVDGAGGWASADSLEGLVETTVQSNPFRLDGEPSTSAGADLGAGAYPPAGVSPMLPHARPSLVLRAINGPPWTAVIEGLPGTEGNMAVVRQGDAFGSFKVRRVTRDAVEVATPDTLLHLTLTGG